MEPNHQRNGAVAAAVIMVFGALVLAVVEDKLDDDEAPSAIPESVTSQPVDPQTESPGAIDLHPSTTAPTDSAPSDTQATSLEPGCEDLGDKVPGTVCVTPQTGSPGEPFEVSGYNFPGDRQLLLTGNNVLNELFFTDSDGAFSVTITPDEIECMVYELKLTDYPIKPLIEFTYETVGC